VELTIENVVWEGAAIFKNNAPVRTYPLGATKHSPYPGNLKNNGIVPKIYSSTNAKLHIGGPPAIYAPYTETRSHSPGWQKKSLDELVNRLVNCYGGKVI